MGAYLKSAGIRKVTNLLLVLLMVWLVYWTLESREKWHLRI